MNSNLSKESQRTILTEKQRQEIKSDSLKYSNVHNPVSNDVISLIEKAIMKKAISKEKYDLLESDYILALQNKVKLRKRYDKLKKDNYKLGVSKRACRTSYSLLSKMYENSIPKEKVREEFEDMEKLFKKHRNISQKLWKETNDKSFLGNVTCSDMILDDLEEKKKQLLGRKSPDSDN